MVNANQRYLLEKAEHMALFAELDPDPLLRIDNKGLILQSNEAARKLFCYQAFDKIKIQQLIPLQFDRISELPDSWIMEIKCLVFNVSFRREGLEETLTVHRLQLPATLRKSFSTSNLIESTFSQGSTVMKNVKRWSNNNQIQRWFATSLLQAEKKFRRVRGYKSMGVLVPALELYTIDKGIDTMQSVA